MFIKSVNFSGTGVSFSHSQQSNKRALTKSVVNSISRVELDVFGLVEEVLVDVLGAEEPGVAVVSDGALRQPQHLQVGALRLRLHGTHHVGHAKQPQQFLVG